MTDPRVLIVIPAYNEAALIEQTVRTLADFLAASDFPYSYRIAVVDNGSTDDTGEIVTKLSSELSFVSLLQLREKGKGRAVYAGWQSEGDILAFMDADLASDLHYFQALVDAVAHGGHALAVGNRLGKTSVIEGRERSRELVSRAYNLLVRALFNTALDDHQCGFKVIHRDAYEKIRPHLQNTEWFFDTELIVFTLRHGGSVHSVDIRWSDQRESKVPVAHTSYAMLKALWQLKKRLGLRR
jgi:glycosyltransferase involved in cell wall biosynthesis